MNAVQLLTFCLNNNIQLFLDEQKQLQLTGDKNALTPELIANLQKEKSGLIALLTNPTQSSQPTEIKPRDPSQPAELSYSQQRLWLIESMAQSSGSYNMPFALSIEGELNNELVSLSLNKIIERHDILRTSFQEDQGQITQHIHASRELEIIQHDVIARPDKHAFLQQLIDMESSYHFDLQQEPLLRVQIVRLNQNEQVMLFNLHHIIFDAWSMDILVQEFTYFYQGLKNQTPISSSPLSLQYADFSAWQREHLSGEILSHQRD